MIEFSKFDIKFQPQSLIKAQILANFLVECTIPDEPIKLEELESLALVKDPAQSLTHTWEIYMDGSSNSKGLGVGIVIVSPKGVIIEHALNLEFPKINN